MKITVIGAGAIGGNLARRLSEAGHDVNVADARGPEAIATEVVAAGAHAVELDSAVEDRDVVILSVPFSVQPKLTDLLTKAPADAIIVDTSNYYPSMVGPVAAVDAGQVESAWSQEQLGRPVVKAWNATLPGTQQTKGLPAGSPGRIAIPVAADSAEARATVMGLVDDTGFDPFDAGVIADSWRQQPGTPAYCTELGLEDLAKAIAAAEKDKATITRDQLGERFASLEAMPSLDETVAINRSAHE
ncbi:NADPH-dependent F420 reductase [Pseudarthrobacter sp. GA104]|uniref:NADPH-dependent F420 reductase n=1 Tax=Pseudarthrobacter sp. GA104 TaxID=2676311 RepID=UPI0012F8D93B|nr:NAD(P)-binding domain-containing protein [Pseudarthrobacter sp. GA104]MUU69887.1 NADP oxidoreductase [Pseudarthrobacter sp. GA104]